MNNLTKSGSDRESILPRAKDQPIFPVKQCMEPTSWTMSGSVLN